MRRTGGLIALVVLSAMVVVALASASANGPRLSPAKERAYPWLPSGVTPAGPDWPQTHGDISNARFSTLKQINTSNVGSLKLALAGDLRQAGERVELQPEHPDLLEPADGRDRRGQEPAARERDDVPRRRRRDARPRPDERQGLWRYVGPAGDTTQAAAVPGTLKAPRGQSYFGRQDLCRAAGPARSSPSTPRPAQPSGQSTSPPQEGTARPRHATSLTLRHSVYDDGDQGILITGVMAAKARCADTSTPERDHRPADLALLEDAGPDRSRDLDLGRTRPSRDGGASVWSLPRSTPSSGSVYYGTGNPIPDIGRQPGKNLWTDSVMAVSLKTGQLKWYFQQVHHDLGLRLANPPGSPTPSSTASACRSSRSAARPATCTFDNAKTGKVPHFAIPEVKVPDLNNGKGAALNNTWPTQPMPQGGAGDIVPMCYTAELAKLHYPTYPVGPNGKPIIPTCPFAPATTTRTSSGAAARAAARSGCRQPATTRRPTASTSARSCSRAAPRTSRRPTPPTSSSRPRRRAARGRWRRAATPPCSRS